MRPTLGRGFGLLPNGSERGAGQPSREATSSSSLARLEPGREMPAEGLPTRRTREVLRQEHKAGERTFVDYAVQTVPVVDADSPEGEDPIISCPAAYPVSSR